MQSVFRRLLGWALAGTRSAYTLLEILLVLAIIIIAAAMFVPSLQGMSGYHKMNGCIDTVRGAWTTARSQAIEDSRSYRFCVAGSHYRIAPDDDTWWPDAQGDSDNPGAVFEGELPGDVRFAEAGQPSSPLQSGGQDKGSGHPNWVTRAVFLPDGTAVSDSQFDFQIPGVRSRTIRLRALTGTIEVKIQGEEDN